MIGQRSSNTPWEKERAPSIKAVNGREHRLYADGAPSGRESVDGEGEASPERPGEENDDDIFAVSLIRMMDSLLIRRKDRNDDIQSA